MKTLEIQPQSKITNTNNAINNYSTKHELEPVTMLYLDEKNHDFEHEYADTIIVGGGVSGLYCAIQLLKRKPNEKILLLESKNRLGGRLNTAYVNINGVDVPCESGGMRFLPKHHNLINVIKDLGLDSKIMPFNMGGDNNLYYIRNRRFTRKDLALSNNKILSECYNLEENEKNKSPNQILNQIVADVLRSNGIDDFPETTEDWKKFRLNYDFQGKPVFEWSFYNFLAAYGLSQECICMLFDSCGFCAPKDLPVNAGSALQLLCNFTTDRKFLRLHGGYELLPRNLEKKIRCFGGDIREGYTVNSINYINDNIEVIASNSSSFPHRFITNNLVLALPSSSLSRLLENSPPLKNNRRFVNLLNSVVTMPLTKINLFFSERWWTNEFGIKNGGSFTDTTLGQVYCFDNDISGNLDPPGAITIYNDSSRTQSWKEFQRMKEPLRSKYYPDIPNSLVPCSMALVKEVMKQLQKLFNKDSLPEPIMATYTEWSESSDTGDGDHLWRAGSNDSEVVDHIYNPTENIYVCNETFSDEQCWVEGALRSAKYVLENGFGLSVDGPKQNFFPESSKPEFGVKIKRKTLSKSKKHRNRLITA